MSTVGARTTGGVRRGVMAARSCRGFLAVPAGRVELACGLPEPVLDRVEQGVQVVSLLAKGSELTTRFPILSGGIPCRS